MERTWTPGTRRIEVPMPLVGPGVLGNGRQGFDARTPDGQRGSFSSARESVGRPSSATLVSSARNAAAHLPALA
jgi:hypothetical protein